MNIWHTPYKWYTHAYWYNKYLYEICGWRSKHFLQQYYFLANKVLPTVVMINFIRKQFGTILWEMFARVVLYSNGMVSINVFLDICHILQYLLNTSILYQLSTRPSSFIQGNGIRSGRNQSTTSIGHASWKHQRVMEDCTKTIYTRTHIMPNKKTFESTSVTRTFCECTKPMRGDVTLQRRLSLAGRTHKMIPALSHRSYTKVSDWCLVDVDRGVFAIWDFHTALVG